MSKQQLKLAKAPPIIKGSFYETTREAMWVSNDSIKLLPGDEEETSVVRKNEPFSMKNRNINR